MKMKKAKKKTSHEKVKKTGRAIYSSTKGLIYQKDIEASLRKAGLRKGDVVMVHSDLQVFGKLADIKDRNKFLDAVLKSFINVLGKEGTLVVPTFTYSFCKKQVFDVKKTPSTVGLFTEYVRTRKQAFRSLQPIFSCAAIGKHSKQLLSGISKSCFGKDSFFDKFYKLKGKLMLFGRPFDITFLHYIEEAHGIDYRFHKQFPGTLIDWDGKSREESFDYFVRYLDRPVDNRMENLGDELDRRGLIGKANLGDGEILLCKSQDAFKVGWEMLDKNMYAFLARNPHEHIDKNYRET
jgi:aminoglycoside 3-N-acetyltransferase